jgi:hypothetical protein
MSGLAETRRAGGENETGSGRRSERSVTDLDEILDVFARDAAGHMAGPPATEQDLQDLERAIGLQLPGSFRKFLARFGGGLFYKGHEIFGPLRTMIHDIEMVPSLGVMCTLVHPPEIPAGVVPFHRSGDRLHLFDLRDPAWPERIVSSPYGATYPDLASFLRAVVLPATPGR